MQMVTHKKTKMHWSHFLFFFWAEILVLDLDEDSNKDWMRVPQIVDIVRWCAANTHNLIQSTLFLQQINEVFKNKSTAVLMSLWDSN